MSPGASGSWSRIWNACGTCSAASPLSMKRAAPCWTRPGNAKSWEIDSKHRLWKQGFRPHDASTMGVTPEIQEQMIKMMLTEEGQLEDVTIEQWFSPAFFQSQLWYYWSSMLTFQPYHSLIEMRCYAVRFMHQLHLIRSLWGILRTKYDQYSSLIRPWKNTWPTTASASSPAPRSPIWTSGSRARTRPSPPCTSARAQARRSFP